MGRMINGKYIPETKEYLHPEQYKKEREEEAERERISLENERIRNEEHQKYLESLEKQNRECKNLWNPPQRTPEEINLEKESLKPKRYSRKRKEYTPEEKEYMEKYGVPFFPDEEKLKVEWIKNAVKSHETKKFYEYMKYFKKEKE